MLGAALRSRIAQEAAAWFIGHYLRFALATTRWKLEGRDHFAPFIPDGPVIFAFWHECLPLMPALYMHARRENPARAVTVMVSRHRDGRLIGGIMARFGTSAVHGSSSRPGPGQTDKGGAAATRAALSALREGQALVVTPDGPRGPPRVAAEGIAALSALSGTLVVPAAACATPVLRLPTWDKMMLPLPFARGALVCLPPLLLSREAGDIARVTGLLSDAAARAEALCR